MAANRPLALPRWLQTRIEAEAARLLFDGGPKPDFGSPAGEPALTSPDSVSWRVFKNPISLFIGGTSAVLLELAEPRVRSGVWDHTSFRTDPVHRLRRTGLAAMMTVYGPKSEAEAMIARVRRVHARIAGETPSGEAYRADDPELLNWVHATAAFGFVEAYNRFVQPFRRRMYRASIWKDQGRRTCMALPPRRDRIGSSAPFLKLCDLNSSLRPSSSNSSISCAARRYCREPRGRFSGSSYAPRSTCCLTGHARCSA